MRSGFRMLLDDLSLSLGCVFPGNGMSGPRLAIHFVVTHVGSSGSGIGFPRLARHFCMFYICSVYLGVELLLPVLHMLLTEILLAKETTRSLGVESVLKATLYIAFAQAFQHYIVAVPSLPSASWADAKAPGSQQGI